MKELIKTFFQDFVEPFFPQVAGSIHFTSVKFLEQENFTDIHVGEKRRIDILAEVKLKEQDQIILIHAEPQASYQIEFNERMFIYCSRLYENYRKPILPFAVFSYSDRRTVLNQFKIDVPSYSVLTFHYYQIHLINKKWRDFIRKNNPVAAALPSKMNYTKREQIQVKLEFLRMIYRMD